MDMRIDFIVRNRHSLAADALREYARRRLAFAIRRFGHRVGHVTMRFVDLNGPRRGFDSRCSIDTELVDGRHVFVTATAAWPFAAIRRAADRLGEALRRDASRYAARRPQPAGAMTELLQS